MRRNTSIALCLAIIILVLTAFPGCGNSEPATVAVIEHGPRLGLVTADTAIVYWDTDVPAAGEVQFGKDGKLQRTARDAEPVTNHHLTLTGLSPDTEYTYRVLTGTAVSEKHAFRTADPGASEFTFVSMSDNRGKSAEDDARSLTPAFHRIVGLAEGEGASFVLHVGDLFYGTDDMATYLRLYDSFKSATDALASGTPLLVSPGNHEMWEIEGGDPLELFNQELAQPPTVLEDYPGTCYSWDWGDSHFACIDTSFYDPGLDDPATFDVRYYPDDEEIAWLDGDLEAAREGGARHLFVFSHAPAFLPVGFTPDSHTHYMGDDPAQRDRFWSVLKEHGVLVYITGHLHTSDVQEVDGVAQWLNGDSGSVEDPTGAGGANHWTRWTVREDEVTAELLDDLGNVKLTRTFPAREEPEAPAHPEEPENGTEHDAGNGTGGGEESPTPQDHQQQEQDSH